MKAALPPVVTAALLLLGPGGCSGGPGVVSLGPPQGKYTHRDYSAVRARWTRSAQEIKALDTTLHVHATCFAPDFAAAFVAMNTHLFKLPAAERRALADRLAAEVESSFTFIIGVATSDIRWNDLDEKDSIWRIALLTDGEGELRPAEVRREKGIKATTTELFPYVTEFSRVYHLRFPRTLPEGKPLVGPGATRLILRFSGPLGATDLVWRLR